MVEKLALPFPLLSDPRGELIKRCGLWNHEEGVSEPAIVALNKSGMVQYLYSGGTDFADRPQEESLLYILDKVGSGGEYGRDEPEIQISAEGAENETVRPDKPAITLEQLKYTLSLHDALPRSEERRVGQDVLPPTCPSRPGRKSLIRSH